MKGETRRCCSVPKALPPSAALPQAAMSEDECGFAASTTSPRPLLLCDLCVKPYFFF